MILRGNRGRRIQLECIWYGLFLLDSGFYFVNQGDIYLILQFVLAGMLLIKSQCKLQKKPVLMLLFLIVSVFVATVFNGDSIRNAIVTSIELVEAFCIACAFFGNRSLGVRNAFRRTLVFISSFSLATFVLSTVAIGIFSKLPVFIAGNGTPAYFAGLSFVYAPREYYTARNMGIFWEPGAFQTYLLLALIYEMFICRERDRRILILHTVALVTTISTTGIVCGFALWVLFAFKQDKKIYGVWLLAAVLTIVGLVYTMGDYLPDSFKFGIITKLENLFGASSGTLITVNTRVTSFVYGIEVFLQHPLVGIGRGLTALKELIGNEIVSCTPVNWFAQYGLFVGASMLYGFYSATKMCSRSIIFRILLLCVVMLSVSTEAFNYSPTFAFIAFIGTMQLTSNLKENACCTGDEKNGKYSLSGRLQMS